MPYGQSLAGLLPATTYYYCAVANNTYGTSFGTVQSFTTPATAPVVTTSGATNLTRTTGLLNGYANPGGDSTTGWFRYGTASPGTCNNTFGTRAPATGGMSVGSGSSNSPFSKAITGLMPATTYYYCAIASNSMGTTWGAVQVFTTPTAPTATTTPATYVTTSSATLNGKGNPQRAATTGWFRYSTSDPGTCDDKFGSRAPVTGSTDLGEDIYDQAYSQSISGLSPATTYYYCAIVASSEGLALGSVLTFTTSSGAMVSTTAATSVTASSATLNGAGNPNGAGATGWFRYSTSSPGTCNDTFGIRAPSSYGASLGSGSASVTFYQGIAGLSPGVTYYYCAIASNTYGTGYGAVLSFTTPAMAPTVMTYNATNLTRTSGLLVGYANPGGDATTGWFRYSTSSPGTCNDTFGTRAPLMSGSSLGSGAGNVQFSQAITGLAPATLYYYCAIASNGLGTAWGAVQTFITPSAPVATTVAASYITTNSATLNGAGNPNRASTMGWFRYSTTNPGTCDDTFGSRAPTTAGVYLGEDISPEAYSQSISGLSSSTTYYYCAIVSSSEGLSLGAVLSFTTAGPVSVTTNAASSVTSTSATLNGAGNPNGASASGWFRYSTSSPGTCNDTFGTRAPSSYGASLGSGATSVTYYQGISGLSPGVTYYYCAIASNSYGTGYGAVQSFTTPATAPTVMTYNATNLTRISGLLVGYANPGGDATTGWFRYSLTSPGTCNDTFGTRAPLMSGSSLGSGSSNVQFSQAIAGLTPATTYYYCAIASNKLGTAWGAVQTFITPSAPVATTTAAGYITTNSATINGTGNPNRASTTGWFRYSPTNPGTCDDTFGSRAPTTAGVYLGEDVVPEAYSQSITGLSSGTTYYYCAIVASSEGLSLGAVLSFTTAGPVSVTTNAASSVTASSATLNGAGNPNGANASGWFRYSTSSPGTCNDTFGTRAPSSYGASLGSGSASVTYYQGISGLSPGVTYYYCAIASNSYGTGYGAVMSFTTPATAPTVTTYNATNLTRTSGLLVGYANPGGDATTGWFRYSTSSPGTCNDTFGTRAPLMSGSSVGSGSSNVQFSQAIAGLTPATTYYYCALASNALGTVWGSVQTFITPSAPTAVTRPAGYIADSSATLNGAGNPNRATTMGWFRYSTTNPGTCDDKFGSRAPLTAGVYLGEDIVETPYSQSISGLSSGTTYYYCALVSSNEGLAMGAVLSFTTGGAPTAITSAASSVTASTATLNGAGTPNGANTTAWFRYNTTSPGTCNDTFGTRAPSSYGASLGAGSVSTPYYQGISGLLPATTYYYCAIVSSTYGTAYGAVMSFTTPAMAPTVTTYNATNLTRTTGLLVGYSNPGGDATIGWFRYSTTSPGTCNDTFGTRAPLMSGVTVGSGASNVQFSQAISGLAPATTYYYCALASNKLGTVWGSVQTFITPAAPTAVTRPAGYIADTSATLNGAGNPNRATTLGWFRYSTTNPGTCDDKFGSRAPLTAGIYLGEDIVDSPYSQSITGLSTGTTYYYCAIVSSNEGLAMGAVLSFTTAGAATAITNAATSVTSTTATINGAGTPNGANTTAWFRYSSTNPGTCNDTFGTRTPSSSGVSLGAGATSVTFYQTLSGLSPGVTYYFCAIASNTYGTGLGAVLSFTTPASPPTVNTDYTSGIATTLNGSANPNGSASTGWFRIATSSPGTCNDTFGTRLPGTGGTALGAGSSFVSYSNPAPGLTPGTTYYYCAIASNALGTSFGVVRSFLAPMAPTVSTLAATPVTASTATLNGSANPNGNSTIAWFRFSTSSPGTCNDVFGTRMPATGGMSLGSDTTATPFNQPISGLSPATTYYFCAVASSAYGTSLGSVLSFTTPPGTPVREPTDPSSSDTSASASTPVITKAATGLAATTAVLNGSANPSGSEAVGWFRYDTTDPGKCDDSFGTRAPDGEGSALGAGTTQAAYSQEVLGLKPATTYYFCAIASIGEKTRFGAVRSLVTKAAAPSVTTAPAQEVSIESAVLGGSVIPNGDATAAWFRYSTVKPESCDDHFGERIAIGEGSALGAGNTPATYAVSLSGLTSGTTYYYCAIASNPLGTTYGELVSFVPGAVAPADSTKTPSVVDPTGTQAPDGVDPTTPLKTLAAAPPTPPAAEPLLGTVITTAPEAEPPVGCSYDPRASSSRSALSLAALLPLLGLLMLRRRRRPAEQRAN